MREFLPLILTVAGLLAGALIGQRQKWASAALTAASPLLMCLSLIDRDPGAGQRWFVYFLLAPIMVLIASELIWREAWPRQRAVFTFTEILFISITFLALIPPILFDDPSSSGPGTRWVVWSLAWLVAIFSLLLLARTVTRAFRDRD